MSNAALTLSHFGHTLQQRLLTRTGRIDVSLYESQDKEMLSGPALHCPGELDGTPWDHLIASCVQVNMSAKEMADAWDKACDGYSTTQAEKRLIASWLREITRDSGVSLNGEWLDETLAQFLMLACHQHGGSYKRGCIYAKLDERRCYIDNHGVEWQRRRHRHHVKGFTLQSALSVPVGRQKPLNRKLATLGRHLVAQRVINATEAQCLVGCAHWVGQEGVDALLTNFIFSKPEIKSDDDSSIDHLIQLNNLIR